MKYLDQYQILHEQLPGYGGGNALRYQLPHIVTLIEQTESKTLLDFGCGKGKYEENRIHDAWGGILPSRYDPAVDQWSELPDGPFDGVFSVDVMEHVPEEEVIETLQAQFDRAEKFVFLGIETSPTKTILPNGENAHCTQENADWWSDKINKANTKGVYTHLHTYDDGGTNDYRIFNVEGVA